MHTLTINVSFGFSFNSLSLSPNCLAFSLYSFSSAVRGLVSSLILMNFLMHAFHKSVLVVFKCETSNICTILQRYSTALFSSAVIFKPVKALWIWMSIVWVVSQLVASLIVVFLLLFRFVGHVALLHRALIVELGFLIVRTILFMPSYECAASPKPWYMSLLCFSFMWQHLQV